MESEKDFINYLKSTKNIEISEEIAERFLALDDKDIILISRSLKDEFLRQIFKYDNLINSNKFRPLFLQSSEELQKDLIENNMYLNYMVESNEKSKGLFVYLSNNLKILILNKYIKLDNMDENIYVSLIKKIDDREFKLLIEKLDNYEIKNLDLYEKKLKIDHLELSNFLFRCRSKQRNINYLFKVKNYEQFKLYDRFNIMLNVKLEHNSYLFENGVLIDKNIIEKINEKHLNSLIDALKEKESESPVETFLSTLYIYSIFGYSNALSIIEDKFTTINDLALEKAAFSEFTDFRRQYRLEHRNEFFSHDMLKKALLNLENGNYRYFNFIYKKEIEEEKINGLKQIDFKNIEESNKVVSEFLKEIILKREQDIQNKFIDEYKITYYKSTKNVELKLNDKLIYRIFENIDLKKLRLDESGRPIINEELQKFLLGNLKKDNDCLLRLIINELAMGLNSTIDNVINNFDIIIDVFKKSNGMLSIYSILDVIDVAKTFLYELQPDEQDITLSAISKIIKSSKYCTNSGEDLVLKAKELHKKRREKIYSTFPLVGGSNECARCKVMSFDDAELLTVGIDVGNCFKVGGIGEDFLRYCLTDKNAVIVEIYDSNNKFYACPFVRNGNTIYGNGIDPEPENDVIKNQLLSVLKEFADKIIQSSDEQEKIEIVAIMDLHQEEFFSRNLNRVIEVPNKISFDHDFYSDYYKEGNKCYIISSLEGDITPKFYDPQLVFYQKRSPNYECKTQGNYDKEKIQQLINSINYTSIDCKNVSRSEKDFLKRNYNGICVDNFQHIVGNKDWFIAIDKCFNISSCCLSYDQRAKDEYILAFQNIKKIYIESLEEELYGKRN